jgi:hypothetical protein
MAKVGKLHEHQLPYNRDLPIRQDVYRCYCGKEFYVEENKDSGFSKSPKKWVELDSSPFTVEYDRTVNGEQFIGRADKDTEFDEEVFDGTGDVQSEGDSGSSEPASGTTE